MSNRARKTARENGGSVENGTAKRRQVRLAAAGFLVAVAIAVAVIVGSPEPAQACFLGIPCW